MAYLGASKKAALLYVAKQVYVEDLFSTYLYEGNGGTQTITNGIDLANEGGMVWCKCRTASTSHALFDTIRGAGAALRVQSDQDEAFSSGDGIEDFIANGFDINNDFYLLNNSGNDYVSWTFRSADNFFFLDEVSHTNGSDTTVDLSSLGTVGMVTLKRTDSTSDWYTWHRSLSAGDLVYLNLTDAETADASIDVSGTMLTLDSTLATGDYMIYAWAHDVAAFGENGDQSIVACGSYTGNGSIDGPEITLGWEPQMVIIKSLASAENWLVFDNMRGWIASSSGDRRLFPNLSNDESGDILGSLQPNGFKVDGNTTNRLNANGENYIYLAIRRGPMRKPESGSDMFAMDTQGGTSPSPPAWNSGWPVDVVFDFDVGGIGNKNLSARLIQNKFLVLNDYQSESTLRGEFDYQNGYSDLSGTNSSNYAWMFRRYPGVLDVVTYEGDGNTGRTVPHNLGVVPEMLVVKNRDDESPSNWCVYHKGLDVDNDGAPETDFIYLNLDLAASDNNTLWNDTAPTETEFTLKTQNQVNSSGDNYIALLFATLDGISKVGSYTGTGSPLTIDCGFSNGAAFVWIKRWDSTGDWILFDSTRGIVSGNEPYLQTNTNNAQVTGNDYIDPDSSGFIVNGGLADINANGGEYIFLAIAA